MKSTHEAEAADRLEVADVVDDENAVVAVMPKKVKAPPYDRNAATFIERLRPSMHKDAAQGMAYTGLMGRARDRIRKNVQMQCAEYFRRKIPFTISAPFDLQDKVGDTAVSGNGTPLVQLLKVTGDDCEIGYGGSSLAESALLYAHPLITAASQAAMAAGLMGLPGFFLTQAAYAVGTLALLGRNWRYIIRPTAQYTLGILAVQTAAASYFPDSAGPVVALGNALMLGRPFLESLIANRSGKDRLFELPETYEEPDDSSAMTMRVKQIEVAADFARNGPVIVLGTANGHLKFKGDPMAPDVGSHMAPSAHEDLSTHMMVIGGTGGGKTHFMISMIQQWLAYGQYRNGRFENCGGALLLDGKGSLPDDVIKTLRAQGLDKVLSVIKVSPEDGGQAMALIEGMTPDQVTSALLAVSNDASDLKNFWTVSSGNWLRHSARLLWACMQLEMQELEAKARLKGYKDYQAWSDDLDRKVVSAKLLKADGTRHSSWQEYAEQVKAASLDVPEPYASAERRYYWHFAALHDFAMSYMEDLMFINGTPPVPDPKTGQMPMPSGAPTVPGSTGLTGWLSKHPDVKENNARGKLIRAALRFASFHLPRQRAELRSDILGTLSTMFTPIMSNEKLMDWCYMEHGCDVLACMRGAVVGISLPDTLYEDAGRIITMLAKKRVFNAVKMRGIVGDWKAKWPDQRPLMCVADEAQILLGQGRTAEEGQLLSIARSLGLRCVFASQTVNAFNDRLGQEASKAFLGNFMSWCMMKSSPESHAYANERLQKQRVFDYNYYLSGGLKTITSNDFERAHQEAMSALGVGKRELNPGQRLAMLKRLRYDLSRPTDVILTKRDREALNNKDDRSGRLPQSLAKLVLMFSAGVVTTNLWEVVRGTASLAAGLIHRAAGALSWTFMGGAVKHDDYRPPRFYVKNRDDAGRLGTNIDLFPEGDWKFLDHQYSAMIAVKRGGHPRRDLCMSLGKLSVEQIRGFARMQGISTVYDELEHRQKAEATANDPVRTAA
ncbi:type IV secretory system conjugative DNA transfer family protein [Burkholderia vietnamiensis]|uniref:type IV secretory system conjugative DNA transfer family protein n=1 Tax=Burkholderia vietnamiensis TaxID=60552 RepID=UPI001CF319BE|nr:type IV secretory system conjugative DNA transfer family protein [Burkholderia vietnamiensis]MCA8147198.1 type IV secretory system conjugative DNA transfer family protein [Burkholderia vietnamiensis]